MSTSFLYHGFSIRGYQYVSTDYKSGTVIFKIKHNPKKLTCSNCGSQKVNRQGHAVRQFRAVPIGAKPVWITLAIQRIFCLVCGLTRQVKIGFADPRRSYTKAFERYALELSKHMTIQDVSRHLGVSWDVIKDIQKRNLHKRFAKPRLHKLKQIAIDEISIGKGHRYLTIVLDLETGAVVFVGDGKGAEALEPFFKRLKYQRSKIEAVAIDMSPAYIAAVMENLPKAKIVFDHFHIIKLYNNYLSDFRRKLYHEAEILKKKLLKALDGCFLKTLQILTKTEMSISGFKKPWI